MEYLGLTLVGAVLLGGAGLLIHLLGRARRNESSTRGGGIEGALPEVSSGPP
jgi:hypothetical protein